MTKWSHFITQPINNIVDTMSCHYERVNLSLHIMQFRTMNSQQQTTKNEVYIA
jgi:hypothetical protein